MRDSRMRGVARENERTWNAVVPSTLHTFALDAGALYVRWSFTDDEIGREGNSRAKAKRCDLTRRFEVDANARRSLVPHSANVPTPKLPYSAPAAAVCLHSLIP